MEDKRAPDPETTTSGQFRSCLPLARWYTTAGSIMAYDAVRLQSHMVFGERGALTTDIEADETQFQCWSTLDDGTGDRTYFWYV